MRRAAAVGALAGLLLVGCSSMGLYDGDGACCRFAPPGPPSDTAGAPTTFTIYNTSDQRVGTIVPQAGAAGRGR
jgi:hypothetical protein